MKAIRTKTITEYISHAPKESIAMLKATRAIVNKNAPEALEVISYGMPTFKLNGLLLYFAAHTHHVGLYPYTTSITHFKKELSKYKTAKGSIKFPYDATFPIGLINKNY